MLTTVLLVTATWVVPAAQDTLSPVAHRVLADVRFLADDRQEGRGVGTAGLGRAGAYIRDGFARAGLQATFQDFTIPPDAPAVLHTALGGTATRNVVAILPGTSPALRGEVVVVGAHYDHLGLGGFGAMDPDSTGRVHNGADDNASGTAALLEIARLLAGRRPARTVVLVAFSGEELGTLGSSYFVQHPVPQPVDSIYAMLNLDMVGRLRSGRLIALGAATAREFPALLDSLNTAPPPAPPLRPARLGRRLGTERPRGVLRGAAAGAALFHRPARRLPPFDRRLGQDQRGRDRAGGTVRRRPRVGARDPPRPGLPSRAPPIACASPEGDSDEQVIF